MKKNHPMYSYSKLLTGLMGIGLLSFSINANANYAYNNSHASFCGLYTGASIGGSFGNEDETIFTNDTFVVPPGPIGFTLGIDEVSQHGQKRNHFTGALFVGYGLTFCDFYLGLEGFLDRSHYRSVTNAQAILPLNAPVFTANLTNNTYAESRLRSAEWGLDLRPGFFLNDCTLFYGRVGVAFNRISIQTFATDTVVSNIIPGGTFTFPVLEGKGSKRVAAIRLGLGIEEWLCDCVTLRGDFIYTRYGSFTVSSSSTTFMNGVAININNGTVIEDLTNVTFMLGVSYYW